ncbi:hypothetical protein PMAYCL1PPCAC_03084, partial [Pristionchus mayeri]
DIDRTDDMVKGGKISSWYEEGKTVKDVFGEMAEVLEKAKSLAVTLLLSCDEEVLSAAGYEDDVGQHLKYAIWLKKMQDGFASISNYDFGSEQWDKAENRAEYMMLAVMLEAGQGCLSIEKCVDANGEENLCLRLDREKIDTVGLRAISSFLKMIQGCISTANVADAERILTKFTPDSHQKEWKESVLEKAYSLSIDQPHIVLPNVVEVDGEVSLKEYAATAEGVINSILDRYTGEQLA